MQPWILIGVACGMLVFAVAHAEGPFTDSARDLAAACAICHGTNGLSAGGGLPNLAGQSREYLLKQLRDFRSGTRPGTIMNQIAKGYTDEQYELLATYFAAQKTR